VDRERAGQFVPGERVVAVVERRRVRARDHRRVVLGEALHDGAAGLPPRAEVGLLEHRQARGCLPLDGAPLALVRLRHRVLRCVAGDQGRDREVVEQLVDGTPDDVVARDRVVDGGAESGGSRPAEELLETRDLGRRGDRGDALRVGRVDRRLDRRGVEHPGRAVDPGEQVTGTSH
jgi:hypothetical protein